MANDVTTNGSDDPPAAAAPRASRLPRWTRQEILVLIQGKKMAESRGRGRVRTRFQQMGGAAGAGMVGGLSPVEPKWASVSSYCRRHGVIRGAVQCRKRWSNLAGDFKKIKDWELRSGTGGGESFWMMRNDLRREKKLPGFFDREVFDILDGTAVATTAAEVEEAKEEGREERGGDDGRAVVVKEEEEVEADADAETEAEAEAEAETVFNGGRPAAEDGLFSDFEQEHAEERPAAVAVTPISVRKFGAAYPSNSDQGTGKEKPSGDNIETGTTSRDGNKRQRTSSDECEGETNLQDQLIEVLKWNSRMLAKQLEVQNLNCQLDREQRKDQTNSMVEVLGKLADAIGKIADKLLANTK